MKKTIERILFTVLMTLIVLTVNAQSKPTRNVAKDRTTSASSVNKHKKRKQTPVKASRKYARNVNKKRPRRHIQRPIETLDEDTTIYFDEQSDSYTINVPYWESSFVYTSPTDGGLLDITYLPSWCSIDEKSNSGFVLNVSENTKHRDRIGSFYVDWHDGYVRVVVHQSAAPY